MSQDSPYTFHRVGAENEPTHYELRDVSGRVALKAFLGKKGFVVFNKNDHIDVAGSFAPFSPTELEAIMREVVR